MPLPFTISALVRTLSYRRAGERAQSSVAVPQQFARGCARALILAKGLFPIYDDGTIAFGTLHTPPFTTRKIVRNLTGPFRFDIKALEVIHHHICPSTFTQNTAITEPSGMGRQC